MPFTDEDLKRAKAELAAARRMEWPFPDAEALIARLEAAENLIRLRGTHIPNALVTREIETAVWAWRKAKGEK